ncbi:unnamed protein product [Effrenium voratum]|nr:unnamed protein product [Effrenium voratum]
MAPAPKAAPAAEVISAVSIRDVLEGTVSLTPAEEIATIGYMEPHLKIYRLLHTSWAAFELYGQIAMEIGTTCLLSGLGYFSLFYLREVDTSDSFVVKGGGWASFGYLSISCWWSLIQCLNISLAGKIFLAVLTLAGPLFIAAKYFRFGDMQSTGLEFVPWAFPAIFTLQATWVLIICWSGVVRKDWPSYWNASRYVNVLHSDKGPPRGHDEVSNGPRQWLSQTRILDRPLSLSDTESEDSTPDFNPSTLASSLVAANLLLDSLDAVLEAEDLSGLKNLQSARNYLYEMTRAVSAIPKSAARSLRNVSGFWVKDASGTGCFLRAQRHHWVDPHDTNQGKTGPAVPCDELAEAAVHLGQLLFCSAENWTKMDMQQLEEYGGFPVSGARSFRAQFTKHLDKNALSGRWQFFGGVVINTVLWLTASAPCFSRGDLVIFPARVCALV